MKKYKLLWANPDTGISGEMHNITPDDLTARWDEARERAGDGEVIFSAEQEEVNEYA